MQTVWISIYTLYMLTHYHGTRQNRMLYFLFFSSKCSSRMRTKQYRLQKKRRKKKKKKIFIQLHLKEGTFPIHLFFAWILRKNPNLSDLQNAWNSCFFLLANVYMLEKVTSAEEIKFSSCSVFMVLDVMNDVYVNANAVLERFTSSLLTCFNVGIFLMHSSV